MKKPKLPKPCPRCGARHDPKKAAIEVRDPDDEIFGCGFTHIERMDDDGVYVGIYAKDGSFVQVWLHSTKGELQMTVGGPHPGDA